MSSEVLVLPLWHRYWKEKPETNSVFGTIAVTELRKEDYDEKNFGQFTLPHTSQKRFIICNIYSEATGREINFLKIRANDEKYWEYDGWVYLEEDKEDDSKQRIRCIVECTDIGNCGKWIMENCGMKEQLKEFYYGKELYVKPSTKFCKHEGCLRCLCEWCYQHCFLQNEKQERDFFCSKHIFEVLEIQ
jgi:hypothetical protein